MEACGVQSVIGESVGVEISDRWSGREPEAVDQWGSPIVGAERRGRVVSVVSQHGHE